MGFMPGPADQAAATAAYMAAMDKWGKTFLKQGKFVLGDKLSIADFKAVPYFWAAICCEPKVDGLKVPAQIKEYVDAFFGAVDAAAFDLNRFPKYVNSGKMLTQSFVY